MTLICAARGNNKSNVKCTNERFYREQQPFENMHNRAFRCFFVRFFFIGTAGLKAELIGAFPFGRLPDGKEAAELIVVGINRLTKQNANFDLLLCPKIKAKLMFSQVFNQKIRND